MRWKGITVTMLTLFCISCAYAKDLPLTLFKEDQGLDGRYVIEPGYTQVWKYNADHFVTVDSGIFWDSTKKDRVIGCVYRNYYPASSPTTNPEHGFVTHSASYHLFNPSVLTLTFEYPHKGTLQTDNDTYGNASTDLQSAKDEKYISVFFDDSPECMPGYNRAGAKVDNYNCVDESGELRITNNGSRNIYVYCSSLPDNQLNTLPSFIKSMGY